MEAAGGQILFWNGVRVMGVLAVSRAIGDHCLRPFVIAQPEVSNADAVVAQTVLSLSHQQWYQLQIAQTQTPMPLVVAVAGVCCLLMGVCLCSMLLCCLLLASLLACVLVDPLLSSIPEQFF